MAASNETATSKEEKSLFPACQKLTQVPVQLTGSHFEQVSKAKKGTKEAQEEEEEEEEEEEKEEKHQKKSTNVLFRLMVPDSRATASPEVSKTWDL